MRMRATKILGLALVVATAGFLAATPGHANCPNPIAMFLAFSTYLDSCGDTPYVYYWDHGYAKQGVLGHNATTAGLWGNDSGHLSNGVASGVLINTGTPGQYISTWDWNNYGGDGCAMLTQEPDVDHLSRQEADESTGRFLSYYEHDLVVVDWDAALIVDQPRNFDETLYVMELANLQLAELEAYDRLLDDALDRAYRDLNARPPRGRAGMLRELREIRIDLARFSDELSNITKFFGDWHLARIYESISARFHLADWHRTIDDKLQTLDDLYQLLNHDRTNRWMLLLEVTIVLLFMIDLVILLFGVKAR